MFTIEARSDGTYRLAGRLDAAQVEKAEGVLGAVSGTVTLDLSELDYIASAGISVVLSLFKRLTASGGTLILSRPTPHVLNVFRYAGLDQVLTIRTD